MTCVSASAASRSQLDPGKTITAHFMVELIADMKETGKNLLVENHPGADSDQNKSDTVPEGQGLFQYDHGEDGENT